MGITLRDAMKIFPFSKAYLAAGENGLEHELTSANIQEVPDVQKWLHGGELLFTSGYSFQTTENAVNLIQALKEKNVAGIAIKPGQYLKQVPEEMLQCAENLDFPLFILPEDLPYMDCIVPILEHITQSQISIMRRHEAIHERLLQAIVEERGLEGLCTLISEIAEGGAAVVSPRGYVLAYAVPEGEKEHQEKFLSAVMAYHFSPSTLRKMKKIRCNPIYPADGQLMYCIPIFAKEDHLAYFVFQPKEVLDNQEVLSYENAGSLIAVQLLKNREALNRDHKIREQLLDDVLAGRFEGEDVICQRGRYVGYDFTAPGCVFVLGINGFEAALSESGRRLPEHSIQKLKVDMLNELEQRTEEARLTMLIINRGMDLIGLVQIRQDADRERLMEILKLTIRRLSSRYKKQDFVSGVARTKQGVTSVPIGKEEAENALKAGCRISEMKSEKVYAFEKLGCLCFLSKLQKDPMLTAFYDEYMGPLEQYDAEGNTVLIETLEQWFTCGMNLRKTADAMYVHKNTIIYRLNKIESLLGCELSEPRIAFYLQLCLQVRYLR